MKALISLFFALCLLIAPALPAAQAGEQQVKLGFIQPDKSLVNGHILRRYYITYLDELSKQTDWDYQLITINASNAFAQLSQYLAENLDFQLVHYTPLESQYIQTLAPLRVAIYGGAPPYIEYNAQTHSATGIYADLIAALAENSGLQFTYIHVDKYADAVALLEKGDADIMLDIFTGAENHLPFYFTNPLLQISYSFIGSSPQAPSAQDDITLAVSCKASSTKPSLR